MSFPRRTYKDEHGSRTSSESTKTQSPRKTQKSKQNKFEYKEDESFKILRKQLMAAESFDGYETDELIDFYWKLRDHCYFCAIKKRYNDATEGEKLMKYIKAEVEQRNKITPKAKTRSINNESIHNLEQQQQAE